MLTGQNGKVARTTSTLAVGCRLAVVRTEQAGGRVALTVGGLRGGRVTVSGAGDQPNTRALPSGTTVASLGVTLRPATRAACPDGGACGPANVAGPHGASGRAVGPSSRRPGGRQRSGAPPWSAAS